MARFLDAGPRSWACARSGGRRSMDSRWRGAGDRARAECLARSGGWPSTASAKARRTAVAHELCPSPIIIYGASRSDTTYLSETLNSHPDIFISNETRIFAWMHESLKVITDDRRLLFRNRDDFIKHLSSVYPGVIRSFYSSLVNGRHNLGDMNPPYFSLQMLGCLDTIIELFPEKKFVRIIRDG